MCKYFIWLSQMLVIFSDKQKETGKFRQFPDLVFDDFMNSSTAPFSDMW